MKSNINKEIDVLFETLENRDSEYKNHLVKDGIINEDIFISENKKVLFICKEPNNPKKKQWDFREWWKTELKHIFAHRIGSWAYGLLENFPPHNSISKSVKFNSLSRIAFINIKKLGGTSKSSKSDIEEHAIRNQDILQKQIKLINPDIIVLGISWWSNARNIIFQGYEHQIVADYVHKYDHHLVINFYHPSTHGKSNLYLYNELNRLVNSNQ